MKTLLFSLLLAAQAFSAGPAKKPATPAEDATSAIDKLQKNWDGQKSWEADFKQVIFAKSLGDRDETGGKIYVSKPDKLRWETPDRGNTEILNGNQLWLVQDNQRRKTRTVDYWKDVSKAVDAASLSFLSGKSKFKDRYTVTVLGDDQKQVSVRLVPKKGEGDTLIAEISKPSYLLRSLTTESVDTRVRIDFSNVKSNIDLDDKLFTFKASSSDIIHNQ